MAVPRVFIRRSPMLSIAIVTYPETNYTWGWSYAVDRCGGNRLGKTQPAVPLFAYVAQLPAQRILH